MITSVPFCLHRSPDRGTLIVVAVVIVEILGISSDVENSSQNKIC